MTNVLTLRIDTESQAHFERLRQLHYPPDRNWIPAHLSLFHTLPDTEEALEVLECEAHAQAAFFMSVIGVRSLGKGVAYKLSSEILLRLHGRLAHAFAAHLSRQDRQPLQPHIVVQNKATPIAARELLATLERTFVPMEVQAVGLDLWHYLDGPWQLAETLPFSAESR